jgi:hypothetical protein
MSHENMPKSEAQLKRGIQGSIEGFVIVGIIMLALFHLVWWSVIPLLAIGYSIIEQSVELRLVQEQKPYPYIVSVKKMMGSWFALVLVGHILMSLFGPVFFVFIPLAFILIGAIDSTTKLARNSEMKTEYVQHVAYVTPIDAQATPAPVIPVMESHAAHYCPSCGNSLQENANFCNLCGLKI